jgi:hypothetical protein
MRGASAAARCCTRAAGPPRSGGHASGPAAPAADAEGHGSRAAAAVLRERHAAAARPGLRGPRSGATGAPVEGPRTPADSEPEEHGGFGGGPLAASPVGSERDPAGGAPGCWSVGGRIGVRCIACGWVERGQRDGRPSWLWEGAVVRLAVVKWTQAEGECASSV